MQICQNLTSVFKYLKTKNWTYYQKKKNSHSSNLLNYPSKKLNLACQNIKYN